MSYTSIPIGEEALNELEGFGTFPFAKQADKIQDLADVFLTCHPDWVAFAQLKDASLKNKYPDELEYLLTEEIKSYPGLKALAAHEAAHELYSRGVAQQPTARAIAEAAASLTGADIHPGATIDPYVFIDHAKGIVIGETATVGQGTQIFHGVTLGAVGKSTGDGPRHPQIGKDVVLSAGTQIMGAQHVGDGALIGPASQVIRSEIGAGVVLKPSTRIADVADGIADNTVLLPRGQQIFTNSRGTSMDKAQKEDLTSLVSPYMVEVGSITNEVIGRLR